MAKYLNNNEQDSRRSYHSAQPKFKRICCAILEREVLDYYDYITLGGIVIIILSVLLLCFGFIIQPTYVSLNESNSANYFLRNSMEVIYFIANTIVAIVAMLALAFAKAQSDHASNQTKELIEQNKNSQRSQQASVYMQIMEKYDNPVLVQSRQKILLIEQNYNKVNPAGQTLSSYAHEHLLALYNKTSNLEQTGNENEYEKTLRHLIFLENLGVLVSRGFLNEKDIYNFMASELIHMERILRDHIIWIRQQHGSASILANALRIMTEAVEAKQKIHEFNKGVYKM
jgi:hypothetical protein